jgi:hypothetical protein
MVSKAYIRRALKLHGVPMAGLSIGILGLVMLLSLTPKWGGPKEVALTTTLTSIKETTKDVPTPVEKETDGNTSGAVAVLKVTAPAGSKSEKQNPQAYSPNEKTSVPATDKSPEQLVYQAETAFAEDLMVEEKLAAIRRLENINDPIVLDAVMMAMDDPDPDLRKAALEILRDMDNEEINEAFLAGLEDDNQEVTDKVMGIMADSDSPTILPSLEQALMDSDDNIQKISMLTLEDISDPGAVDILIETGLLNHNEAIRKEVLDSLEFITDQRFESYQEAKIWWELNRDTFEFD